MVFVAAGGRLAGLLGVADPVKDTTAEALAQLHGEGLRVVMLTGDSRATALAVAAELGIDEVIAGVLPDAKADAIARLQAEGRVVAMAGDGINDAPALARADVGIAMGTGTDVAIESAGVTLVRGDLRGIVRARRLSRKTMANIRQNLIVRVRLQRDRRADRGRRPLPGVRPAPVAGHRRRGDELLVGVGHHQRAPPPPGRGLTRRRAGYRPWRRRTSSSRRVAGLRQTCWPSRSKARSPPMLAAT